MSESQKTVPTSPRTFRFAAFRIWPLLLLAAAGGMSAAVPEPVDIRALFPVAGEPATLTFRAPDGVAEGTTHAYRIINYEGRVVEQAVATVDARGILPVTMTLPAGYHEVIFDAQEAQATGLWSALEGEAPADPFFSIDTALSWLTKPAARPDLIGNLPRVISTGGLARERLSWNAVQPAENRRDWETPHAYETTRRLYAAAGVPLLEMFHNAPAWLGKAQGGVFPDNLVAAGRAWREVAQRWHGCWAALEVWNEPDIGFGGNQPADQYLPLLKTIRHTMRADGIDTPLGGGVFASLNRSYLDLAARNGLLDECDFVSFHYYGDPLGLERLVGEYRTWLKRFGHENKPLWITEVGQNRPGYPGVRPATELQARTALAYAMQSVEARASGIARFFPFVYADYSEGEGARHYGMLDGQRSPLRMLAAPAQAARVLAGTTYLGDVPVERVPGAKRIRVFGQAGTEDDVVAVIYTGEVAHGAVLTLPFEAKAVLGIDGRSLEMPRGKAAPVPDGLAYVRAARAQLAGVLTDDTEAMRLYRLGRAEPPSLPDASPLVLQPQIDPRDVQVISARGYHLPAGRTHLPVKVGVNNLSGSPRHVRVFAGNEPGQAVTVAAGTREIVTFDVELAALPEGFGTARQVCITATSEDSGRIAPAELALVLTTEGGIADHLRQSSYRFELALDEAYRWEKNSSGALTFQQVPPTAWGFAVTFSPGVDRWAYPRYVLPQEVDHSQVTGVLVRARCLQPATVRLMSWTPEGRMSVTPFPIFPADGEWHVVYIPLTSYQAEEGARLAKLSIGINSRVATNTIEISDLYVIGK